MDIIKLNGFSKIFAIEDFEADYKKLLGKSGEYNSCSKKLMYNLSILENASCIEAALLNKNIEKLKNIDGLYSIRNISKLNPRTIFFYMSEDGSDAYILLNSFLEKSTSDYDKAVKKAENILNVLGL